MKETEPRGAKPSTSSVHGGSGRDQAMRTLPKTMPIYETSVFTYESLAQVDDFLAGNPDNYMYTRLGNPNQRALEDWIRVLETAPLRPLGRGAVVGDGPGAPEVHPSGQPWDACTAGSGMGALMAAVGALADAGATVAIAKDIYGGTQSLMEKEFARWGVRPVFVDCRALVDGSLAFPAGAVILLVESASNPLVRVADIPRLAQRAHEAGAKLLVDNTFLSPLLFKPLALGADGVVHSTTKYINGHSDATGGVFTGPADWVAKGRRVVANGGAMLSPFEAWLTLRGAKTLALRMVAHSANALAVASWLEAQPSVARVWYPGLSSHPDHALARELFPQGMGGMLSFDVATPSQDREVQVAVADAFVRGLDLIKFAPSLAGVSTTISHPGKTSHRGHSAEGLRDLGISQATIRLSVGIEEAEDIMEDLARGLEAAMRVTGA